MVGKIGKASDAAEGGRRGAPAHWTAQLAVMHTPEVAAEIRAWAAHGEMSQSFVLRQIIAAGLAECRKRWEETHGELPEKVTKSALATTRAIAKKATNRKTTAVAAKRAARTGERTSAVDVIAPEGRRSSSRRWS